MSQKKFCNYCKGSGHLIAECKHRPQNRRQRVYYSSLGALETLPHSTDAGLSLMASTPQSIVPVPPVVSSTTGSEFLKLSDAQALIQNALAGLDISGPGNWERSLGRGIKRPTLLFVNGTLHLHLIHLSFP